MDSTLDKLPGVWRVSRYRGGFIGVGKPQPLPPPFTKPLENPQGFPNPCWSLLPIILSDNPQVLSRTVSPIVNASSATVLRSLHVPQLEDLKKLKTIATEGGLTGHISFDYPTPYGNTLKIPFGALAFWEELLKIWNGRDQWRRAIEWLKEKHAYQTLKLLKDMSWNVCLPMCGGCTTQSTLDIGGFCSTDWLSSQHIDIMCAAVNDELKQSSVTMKMLRNSPYIDKLISVYCYGQGGYLTAQSSAFVTVVPLQDLTTRGTLNQLYIDRVSSRE